MRAPPARARAVSGPSVAIVGGGIGGLSAAIHLRLAGFPVTLFEANEVVGGRAGLIRRDGFLFDTGPSLLNYPWVFEDLFRIAGRRLAEHVELRPVDPSVRFVWPDGATLQLSSSLDVLLREMETIEPGCGPGLQRFLRDAAAKYELAFERLVPRNADRLLEWLRGCSPRDLLRITVWRSLDRELGRFFRSARIREALGSYAMYLGGSPLELPGFFSILPYGELAHGLWLPRGGMRGLVEAYVSLARDLGVEVATSAPVTKIDTRDGAVTGITLRDGSRLGFTLAVSNVDVPTTDASLLDEAARSRLTRKERRRLKMTPAVLTFYWGYRGAANGLAHHTIFMPRDAAGAYRDLFLRGRVPDDLPFYVAVPSRTDDGLAPAGHSLIFVMVPMPRLAQLGPVSWDATVDDVRRRVVRRLSDHGTRLDPACLVVEEVLTPAAWRDRFGLHEGSAFGASHVLSQIGPFRRSNRSASTRGLYYVGASTTPGTGLPMVTLGGRLVAERILADAR